MQLRDKLERQRAITATLERNYRNELSTTMVQKQTIETQEQVIDKLYGLLKQMRIKNNTDSASQNKTHQSDVDVNQALQRKVEALELTLEEISRDFAEETAQLRIRVVAAEAEASRWLTP